MGLKLIIITIYVHICVPLSNGGKHEYLEKAGTAAFQLECNFNNTDSLIRETIKKYGINLEWNSVKVDVETTPINCK